MKRKFILLPVTLTALTPTIGMVGCNIGGGDKPEPTPPEPTGTVNLDIYDDKGKDYGTLHSQPLTLQKDEVFEFNANFNQITSEGDVMCLEFMSGTHPILDLLNVTFTLKHLYVGGQEVASSYETGYGWDFVHGIYLEEPFRELLMLQRPVVTGIIQANEDINGALTFYYID